MTPSEPERLAETDQVDSFDCGIDQINDWLAHRAAKNEKSGDSRTYVSRDLDTGEIAGFYSLSASGLQRHLAKGWLSRNAPNPVPVILLGQLATSRNAKGLGLGRDLLADAIRKATFAATVMGARALVAEAIDNSAAEFYLHHDWLPIDQKNKLFGIKLG